MKKRFLWTSAMALGVTLVSQMQSMALTNGVVVISTRTASDALYRQISSSTLYDADDNQGPGAFSPGDAAMATLLQDYGYATRLLPEWLLRPDATDPSGAYSTYIPNPEFWYGGGGGPTKPAETNNPASAQLVIISGSGSSADMPPPNTNGIPIMMGEHSCLGDVSLAGQSSIFMYSNKAGNSGNDTATTATGLDQFMHVLQPTHPIMQGIPLDANGNVKIWRDPYPEENAHVPSFAASTPPKGAKLQYKYSWTRVDIDLGRAVPAAGTTVIGVKASNTNKAVFAVMDAGGTLADTTAIVGPWNGLTVAPSRLVHLFVNEHGSGDARRAFNALTDIGKVIFVRTCKWAMGETLTPFVPLNINVSQLSPTSLQLSWNASADKNYKVLGSANITTPLFNWETLKEDIAGVNGTITKTVNIAAAPQAAFLIVQAVP